jgi:hypothetical protein
MDDAAKTEFSNVLFYYANTLTEILKREPDENLRSQCEGMVRSLKNRANEYYDG